MLSPVGSREMELLALVALGGNMPMELRTTDLHVVKLMSWMCGHTFNGMCRDHAGSGCLCKDKNKGVLRAS